MNAIVYRALRTEAVSVWADLAAVAADLSGGSLRMRPDLGVVQHLLRRSPRVWADSVVPFAMEVMAGEVDGFDFGVAHLDAFGIGVGVKFATHFQAVF